MEINKIKVGKRFRKDLGDLSTLKESINKVGLLQPIVIDENNNLIAGERRLISCKELGIKDIIVNQINIENTVVAECDENVIRKNFTPSESVAIWEAIDNHQGKLQSDSDQSKEQPRDIASKKTGVGIERLSQAKQVIEYGDENIIEEMDKTGNVNNAYNEIKKQKREVDIEKQKEDIKAGIDLPEGKFEIISFDPPWDYGTKFNPEGRRVANPYPEMSLEELEKIELPSSDNCILWFWTTHKYVFDAKKLMNKFGFDYKGILVWNKQKMGMGSWLRMQCEFCLVGIKGNPIWDKHDIRDIIEEPRREHSKKPEAFYKMIENNFVGRKIDYFSRAKREGWEVFGNDIK